MPPEPREGYQRRTNRTSIASARRYSGVNRVTMRSKKRRRDAASEKRAAAARTPEDCTERVPVAQVTVVSTALTLRVSGSTSAMPSAAAFLGQTFRAVFRIPRHDPVDVETLVAVHHAMRVQPGGRCRIDTLPDPRIIALHPCIHASAFSICIASSLSYAQALCRGINSSGCSKHAALLGSRKGLADLFPGVKSRGFLAERYGTDVDAFVWKDVGAFLAECIVHRSICVLVAPLETAMTHDFRRLVALTQSSGVGGAEGAGDEPRARPTVNAVYTVYVPQCVERMRVDFFHESVRGILAALPVLCDAPQVSIAPGGPLADESFSLPFSIADTESVVLYSDATLSVDMVAVRSSVVQEAARLIRSMRKHSYEASEQFHCLVLAGASSGADDLHTLATSSCTVLPSDACAFSAYGRRPTAIVCADVVESVAAFVQAVRFVRGVEKSRLRVCLLYSPRLFCERFNALARALPTHSVLMQCHGVLRATLAGNNHAAEALIPLADVSPMDAARPLPECAPKRGTAGRGHRRSLDNAEAAPSDAAQTARLHLVSLVLRHSFPDCALTALETRGWKLTVYGPVCLDADERFAALYGSIDACALSANRKGERFFSLDHVHAALAPAGDASDTGHAERSLYGLYRLMMDFNRGVSTAKIARHSLPQDPVISRGPSRRQATLPTEHGCEDACRSILRNFSASYGKACAVYSPFSVHAFSRPAGWLPEDPRSRAAQDERLRAFIAGLSARPAALVLEDETLAAALHSGRLTARSLAEALLDGIAYRKVASAEPSEHASSRRFELLDSFWTIYVLVLHLAAENPSLRIAVEDSDVTTARVLRECALV